MRLNPFRRRRDPPPSPVIAAAEAIYRQSAELQKIVTELKARPTGGPSDDRPKPA